MKEAAAAAVLLTEKRKKLNEKHEDGEFLSHVFSFIHAFNRYKIELKNSESISLTERTGEDMKEYTVLTINPGSTSNKIGIMKGSRVILDTDAKTDPDDFKGCASYADQVSIREKQIYAILEENHIDLKSIDAVSGRGVGIYSCEGGTYRINQIAYEHALHDQAGINHPATLGIVLAKNIGDRLGVPSFFVNPMCVDELCDEARITGVRGIYRTSRAHPLNMKQTAIHHSELHHVRYEDCNYIVIHMGGAISVAAHRHGKAIDQTRITDGQGPISPNRTGDICFADVKAMSENGKTLEEIRRLCTRSGGLIELCGTDDVKKIRSEMIPAGDRFAELALSAMEYTIVKWAGAMAGVLKGKTDAILITGGLANDEVLVQQLKDDLSWIAPVYVYPGSFETEALAEGAVRVLSGQEECRQYSGYPVFEGFSPDFLPQK